MRVSYTKEIEQAGRSVRLYFVLIVLAILVLAKVLLGAGFLLAGPLTKVSDDSNTFRLGSGLILTSYDPSIRQQLENLTQSKRVRITIQEVK